MDDLKTIKEFVNNTFTDFGPNKKREITRLLFEIAKRENGIGTEIVCTLSQDNKTFERIKGYLLKRRFPRLTAKMQDFKPSLTGVEINPQNKVAILAGGLKPITPQNLFIEEAVVESELTKKFKQRFPQAQVHLIPSYKDFVQSHKYSIKDYNERANNFFVIKESFDFFRLCPCTPHAYGCGYHIANLGMGCPMECTYCYLQDYTNAPGIAFPANLDDFFDAFKNYEHDIRLGSGEFTDSLVFDNLTEYSPQIIDFFRQYPNARFEFKTKTNNIDLILKANPALNIVIAWSVNPPNIIKENEFYTATLDERLAAAKKCVEAGFRVGFHFDPIIFYEGWEGDYEQVVNQIFDSVEPSHVAWISLGTLRLTATQKKVIENRFPHNKILDGELVLGFDEKLRYPAEWRADIYRKMFSWIRRRNPKAFVYLCMEEKTIHKACLLPM